MSAPFIATAIALFFHTSLPYMAEASIAVWITVPHHYAGWMRGYGLGEDWSRWRTRLDFWLSVVLYSNMLLTAPLWAELWIAEL